MRTKKCGRCKELMDVSMFYKDKYTVTGLTNRCKMCIKEKILDDRLSGKLSMWKRRIYINTKVKCKAYHRKLYIENPIKYKARRLLTHEIKYNGFKLRNSCEICLDNLNVISHHWDYSKPLDIIRLCKSCHTKLHFRDKHH